MARIRLLEYPVVPVVAAGVIGQQIVDCRVLVSVPVFVDHENAFVEIIEADDAATYKTKVRNCLEIITL